MTIKNEKTRPKIGDIIKLGQADNERFKGATAKIHAHYWGPYWIVQLLNTGSAPNYAMPKDGLIIRRCPK